MVYNTNGNYTSVKKIYFSSKILLRPLVSNGKYNPRDGVFFQEETIKWDWNSHKLRECTKKKKNRLSDFCDQEKNQRSRPSAIIL